jgi:prepilin signal peptidase PulO-like enzyme (type II secretory pathway)
MTTAIIFPLTAVMLNSFQHLIPIKSGQILNQVQDDAKLFIYLGIVSTAIVIFFSDLKYRIIPDSMQILLFAFSFLLLVTVGLTPTVFLNHVAGAFVVMAPILFLFLITKGGGMGFGDVKLAFSMGFLLGPLGGLASLYIAFVSGAVIGIFLLILKKKGLKSKIAFGPFLIIGLVFMLFWGEWIIQMVRELYRI